MTSVFMLRSFWSVKLLREEHLTVGKTRAPNPLSHLVMPSIDTHKALNYKNPSISKYICVLVEVFLQGNCAFVRSSDFKMAHSDLAKTLLINSIHFIYTPYIYQSTCDTCLHNHTNRGESRQESDKIKRYFT